jgi:hypothetical protein
MSDPRPGQRPDLPLDTMVVATGTAYPGRASAQLRQLLTLAAHPVSIAELGAHLGVPLGTAQQLVARLAGHGAVRVTLPHGGSTRPEPEVLSRLLEGLRGPG